MLKTLLERESEMFEKELRFDIGYSGGASDKDIVTCETSGGRSSSQRFDVLVKGLKDWLTAHDERVLAEVKRSIKGMKLLEVPGYQSEYNQALDDILQSLS